MRPVTKVGATLTVTVEGRGIDGMTVSGGEPVHQPRALAGLLEAIKA